MNRNPIRLMLACVFALGASAPAYAQGGATSSLSGVVVDAGGGVVPGATSSSRTTAPAHIRDRQQH